MRFSGHNEKQGGALQNAAHDSVSLCANSL